MLAPNNTIRTMLAGISSVLIIVPVAMEPCLARAPDDQSVVVICQVEGPSTIKSIVPAGSVVQKGQLVCELDASALRPELATQQLVVKKAEAALEAARKVRTSAALALKEYGEKTFEEELEESKKDVVRAEQDLADASDRVAWATRMLEQVKLSKACKIAEELHFQRTKFALELAQSRRANLENLTQPRFVKTLKGWLSRAHGSERLLEAALKLGKGREDRILKQIAACQILAPSTGKVVFGQLGPGLIRGWSVRNDRELADLQGALDQQKLAVQSAEAGNQEALNEVEIADLTLHEYTEGRFIHENAQTMAGIKRAEVELVKATQIVDWGKQIVLKGLITPPEKVILEHWYETAAREHQLANQTRNSLVTVEKVRKIRRLRAEVDQRRSEQQVAQAILELELARESLLRDKLVRMRKQAAGGASARSDIPELKPGTVIYEGQVLALIVP